MVYGHTSSIGLIFFVSLPASSACFFPALAWERVRWGFKEWPQGFLDRESSPHYFMFFFMQVANSLPDLLPEIQMQLMDVISLILSRKPFSATTNQNKVQGAWVAGRGGQERRACLHRSGSVHILAVHRACLHMSGGACIFWQYRGHACTGVGGVHVMAVQRTCLQV